VSEHHVVIVVQSELPYREVMALLVEAAREQFAPTTARGYDPRVIEAKLAAVTAERNELLTAYHDLKRTTGCA